MDKREVRGVKKMERRDGGWSHKGQVKIMHPKYFQALNQVLRLYCAATRGWKEEKKDVMKNI